MRNTSSALKEFESSSIWLDVLDELAEWNRDLASKLASGAFTITNDGLRAYASAMNTIEEFKTIISRLTGIAEDEEQEAQENRKKQ